MNKYAECPFYCTELLYRVICIFSLSALHIYTVHKGNTVDMFGTTASLIQMVVSLHNYTYTLHLVSVYAWVSAAHFLKLLLHLDVWLSQGRIRNVQSLIAGACFHIPLLKRRCSHNLFGSWSWSMCNFTCELQCTFTEDGLLRKKGTTCVLQFNN